MNLEAIYREVLRTEDQKVAESDPGLGRAWSELEYQALWYSGAFGSTFRATNRVFDRDPPVRLLEQRSWPRFCACSYSSQWD
jgi:hypothetical protein